MSRSHKKNPSCVHHGNSDKPGKVIANRKFRSNERMVLQSFLKLKYEELDKVGMANFKSVDENYDKWDFPSDRADGSKVRTWTWVDYDDDPTYTVAVEEAIKLTHSTEDREVRQKRFKNYQYLYCK